MTAAAPAGVDVVVVGAGPVGCALAVLLGQFGVRTAVLERHTEVHAQPRAVHLDDEVCKVLDSMGVADQFLAVSWPAEGLQMVDRSGRVLARFDRGREPSVHGFAQANMFDQPDLERIVRSRMGQLAPVTFIQGALVSSAAALADGGVRVTYTDLDQTTRHIDARFVVGADGAHSLVREQMGASLRELGFKQRWLVIDAISRAPLGHWNGVHQVCDAGRGGTFMRIGRHRYRWEFQLRDHESAGDFEDTPRRLELLGPWLGNVEASDLQIVRTAEYTFTSALADVWRCGPMLIAGDAAHLTPPFIGQGLGAGLRDAHNLAWKLAGVVDGSLDDDALDSYQCERRAHARAMIALATAMGAVMTGGASAGNVARGVAARPLSWLVQKFDVAGSGTTPRLRGGPLVRRSGDRLAGRLCPSIGEPVTDWTLVTYTEPSPSVREALTDAGVDVRVVRAQSVAGVWLTTARRTAALVRPDGTVAASGASAALVSMAPRRAGVPR